LVPVDGGRIVLDGAVLDDPATGAWVPPEQRPIGYVFQDYLLFPHLSAVENVAFGLRCRGIPKRQARATARSWLHLMGLEDHAEAKPRSLSGGQAQRVALARALATQPRLLLLDEPLAALDAATRIEVRADLRRHLATFEGIGLVVTHDPVEAMVLADRLVVLEAGRVIQSGSPTEMSRRPRSPYVARLVGINLLRGRTDGSLIELDRGGELHTTADGTAVGEVFAAVRPQSVALYRTRPDGTPRNIWPGVVVDLDIQADRVRAHVDGAVPIIAEVTAASAAELDLHNPHATIWVAIKATDIDVYPI
jgi:molybdate transport system ATP-binding protein